MAKPASEAKREANRAVAALLALFLVFVCGTVLWEFVDAFFLAAIGYIFMHPAYRLIRAKGMGRAPSAFAAMMLGAIVLGMPALLLMQALLNEASNLFNQAAVNQQVGQLSQQVGQLANVFPSLGSQGEVSADFANAALKLIGVMRNLIFGWLQDMGKLALDIVVALFTLYYLLVAEERMRKLRAYIPFSQRNTDELVAEGRSVLYSSILVTGVMAVVQSVLMTIVFLYFNVPGAVFLGLVSAVLACVPFTGLPFIWVPVAVVEAASGNWGAAAGIVVAGIIIAIIDNVRPIMQNRIGTIHPMVSLLGVIVGLPYFGVLGLLIGPVILAIALLTVKLFREEYL